MKSPLSIACENFDSETVKFLLELGANSDDTITKRALGNLMELKQKIIEILLALIYSDGKSRYRCDEKDHLPYIEDFYLCKLKGETYKCDVEIRYFDELRTYGWIFSHANSFRRILLWNRFNDTKKCLDILKLLIDYGAEITSETIEKANKDKNIAALRLLLPQVRVKVGKIFDFLDRYSDLSLAIFYLEEGLALAQDYDPKSLLYRSTCNLGYKNSPKKLIPHVIDFYAKNRRQDFVEVLRKMESEGQYFYIYKYLARSCDLSEEEALSLIDDYVYDHECDYDHEDKDENYCDSCDGPHECVKCRCHGGCYFEIRTHLLNCISIETVREKYIDNSKFDNRGKFLLYAISRVFEEKVYQDDVLAKVAERDELDLFKRLIERRMYVNSERWDKAYLSAKEQVKEFMDDYTSSMIRLFGKVSW